MMGLSCVTLAVLFCLISVSLCQTATPAIAFDDCKSYMFSALFLNGRYKLCWSMLNDNKTITVQIQVGARQGGWIGLGISNQQGGGMVNADIMQGAMKSGAMGAWDLWATSTDTPIMDRTQNLLAISGDRKSLGGGTTLTTVRFQRQVDTGDSSADRPFYPGIAEYLVAYSNTDNIRDRHVDFAMVYFNAFTGELPQPGAGTTSNVQVDPKAYAFSTPLLAPACTLYWNMAATTIDIALACKSLGWIAFGITDQKGGGMTNADIWVGYVVGSSMVIEDRWSTSQATPALDATQDLTNMKGSRVNGVTTMMFTRKLTTNDVKDRPIAGGLMECLIAFGSSDVLGYHDKNRATVYVNFQSGVAVGNVAVPPAAIDTAWNPASYPSRVDVFPGEFELYWAVSADKSSVSFAVRSTSTGWVGVGVALDPAGRMAGSDIMLATFDATGNPLIDDQLAVGASTPITDSIKGGKNSFTAMSGSKNATGMTVKWTRAFDTQEPSADVAIPATGKVTMVVAFGSTADVSYHGANRASVSIDLFSGTSTVVSTPGENLRIAHGSLMAIAFGIFMVFGVVVAVAVPKNQAWWFPAHWASQGFASLLVIISFIIILVYYSQGGIAHFTLATPTQGAHGIIGIIVISLVVFQVILGVVADRVWQAEYKKTHEYPSTKVFPDVFHWWTGRGILLLAMINIYLGIAEMQWAWGWYLGWTLAVLILGAVLVVAYLKHHMDKKKAAAASSNVVHAAPDSAPIAQAFEEGMVKL